MAHREERGDADYDERIFLQPVPQMMWADRAERKHDGEEHAEDGEVTRVGDTPEHRADGGRCHADRRRKRCAPGRFAAGVRRGSRVTFRE